MFPVRETVQFHAGAAAPDPATRTIPWCDFRPTKNTAYGIRAVSSREVVTAESAEAYLVTKFEDHLEAARAAMTTLASADRPLELAAEAFALYKAFRPVVPKGVRGWGAKGVLDLWQIRTLAKG